MAATLAVLAACGYVLHRVTELEQEVAELRGELTAAARLAAPTPESPDDMPPAVASPPAAAAEVAEQCNGAVDRAALERTVSEHGPDVFACHAERAEEHPDLSGVLRILVTVDDRGEVERTRLESSLGDAELERCVTESLEGWSFPRAENGRCAELAIPFALGAEQQAG